MCFNCKTQKYWACKKRPSVSFYFEIKHVIFLKHLPEKKFESFLLWKYSCACNRIVWFIFAFICGPFSISAMNECVNDIRINLLSQKDRAYTHPTAILYKRSLHIVASMCIETKCKPYLDMLNHILSFSWHNKFHSTSGKPKSFWKSQNIAWKKSSYTNECTEIEFKPIRFWWFGVWM